MGTRGDHAGFQRDGGELPEVPPRAGPRLSSRLTERPTLACVSLGKGSVVYDSSFDLFKEIGHLCRLCKAIAGNSELVKPGGAQCLPSGVCGSQFLRGRRDGGGAPGSKGGQPRGHSRLAYGYLQTHVCSSVHTRAGSTRTFACLQESGLVRERASAQRYPCQDVCSVCRHTCRSSFSKVGRRCCPAGDPGDVMPGLSLRAQGVILHSDGRWVL